MNHKTKIIFQIMFTGDFEFLNTYVKTNFQTKLFACFWQFSYFMFRILYFSQSLKILKAISSFLFLNFHFYISILIKWSIFLFFLFNTCMYVCMYVCIHASKYIHILLYIYIYIYIYINRTFEPSHIVNI